MEEKSRPIPAASPEKEKQQALWGTYRSTETVPKEKAAELAKRFCPVFEFHRNERYYPTSIEQLLEKSELWYQDHRVLPQGGVNKDTLLSATVEVPLTNGDKVTVKPTDELYNKWRLRLLADPDEPDDQVPRLQGFAGQQLKDCPVYVRVRKVETNSGATFYELTYMLLYLFNGNYTICGCGTENCLGPAFFPWSCKAGYHETDLERLTVRVDINSEKAMSAYFGCHRNRDGTWITAEDLDMTSDPDDRFHVYVAKTGHGHYWRAGCWPRICCFANDWTDMGGDEWNPDPSKIILVSDEDADMPKSDEEQKAMAQNPNRWLQYKGKLGATGVDTPAKQDWWQREFPVSRGAFVRWWCCCFPEYFCCPPSQI